MADSQKDILNFILKHPKVHDAWITTQGRLKGKYRIGKTGLPDIIGYLKDGRFLAIEKKQKGENISDGQSQFLKDLLANNGVGGIAITIEDAREILGG